MRTHAFPTSEARAGDRPTARAHGPAGRWALHRAGIVNVWQYDRAELGFAGGRLLLRGKNGAGKSKALEVLLPFLLDGDTRQLDATGRDRTTVTWLMTDGRGDGNHVGYVWLELRCARPEGTEEFMTLGAGLKASTATRRADSWFFLTGRRVGVDLDLDVAGECLSVERLKEAIGEEAVTTSGAEHGRRVGRHLFGLFDEARYRNLLHLLHRLRDPNIGNRVEAGELASVLTEALPPVDERVLSEAAGHFDDLDAIREQVERSNRTALALGQFLGTYRGYTRTVLRRRAAAVERAEAGQAAAARATRGLAREVDEAERAVGQAQETLAGRRRDRVEREAERRELERSEGYRAHHDLADRQERVAALDAAARAAESGAALAEAAHQRSLADLAAALDDVGRSLAAAGEAAGSAAGLAADASLPRCSAPSRPPIGRATSTRPSWRSPRSGRGPPAPSSTAAGSGRRRSGSWPSRPSAPGATRPAPRRRRRRRRPRPTASEPSSSPPGRPTAPPSRGGPTPSPPGRPGAWRRRSTPDGTPCAPGSPTATVSRPGPPPSARR